MDTKTIKNILEAVLLSADSPLTLAQLEAVFSKDDEKPSRDEIRDALNALSDDYEKRGFEMKKVASGYRLQVRQDYAPWVAQLWEDKPARYSRALLETIALIAYRQPITRGEIEEVRGVSVSSNIVRTLMEREWIKVLGHKDVPGKPVLYGTTKEFLDYFNLKSLDQLPALADIKDLDKLHEALGTPVQAELAVEEDDLKAESGSESESVSKAESDSDSESESEREFDDKATELAESSAAGM